MYADIQGGLNLKHASPSEHPLNMGAISKAGLSIPGRGLVGPKAVARTYSEGLAKLNGGAVNEAGKNPDFGLRTGARRMPRPSDLLPQHDAMEQYIRESLAALPAG